MFKGTGRGKWLPEAGENLFQQVKKETVAAEARGRKIYRLSIGQPRGSALSSARAEAARVIQLDDPRVHSYQDNGCEYIPDFAERFVRGHFPHRMMAFSEGEIAFLPTPGTKPMLGLVALSCGAEQLREKLAVFTHTNPGYPTPKVQAGYLGVSHRHLQISLENGFLPDPEDIVLTGMEQAVIMVNFPHNPSGVIATRDYWRKLCAFCVKHGIRLVNDAAYASLAFSQDNVMLAEVAHEFPGLSWLEFYSASKILGNACGWRVGAVAGSPDFIADFARIKGETDSGFNAALAAGALFAIENDQASIADIRRDYVIRMDILRELIAECGLRLAIVPQAGFFALCHLPRKAFGIDVEDAYHFNRLLIENTGVVGVHFHPYLRFSTCAPLENEAFVASVREGLLSANVEY